MRIAPAMPSGSLRDGTRRVGRPIADRGYRSAGRFPSSAEPTRTCVAPWATAIAKSWLMPGGHPGGSRVGRAYGARRPRRAGRTRPPGHPRSGATPITPPRSQRLARRDGVAQARDVVGSGSTPGGVAIVELGQGHLDQHHEATAGLDCRPVEGRHQPRPVDGLDDVGVASDRAGLVGLELTDEVPAHVDPRAGAALLGRLLVTVLRDVVDPEAGQPTDVLGRPGLRDSDEGDLVGRSTGVLAGAGDLSRVPVGGWRRAPAVRTSVTW